MKLALGTVQFGTEYGAFNGAGRVTDEIAQKILDALSVAGVTTLDTASAYGDSELVLGRLNAPSRFRIVSKIPALPQSTPSGVHVAESLAMSLDRLTTESISALMVHQADDLLGKQGDAIWSALEVAKDAGKVKCIGASVYTSAQIDRLLDRYPLEIVQLPYSVFDQRIVQSGALDRLKKAEVEVHVRSVFLQGFALADPDRLPPYLMRHRKNLVEFRELARESNLSPLEAALILPRDDPRIDAVVVGVQTLSELHDILTAWKANKQVVDFASCASDDIDFVNPANWETI